MKYKKINPFQALVFRTETKLTEINRYVRTKAREIYADVIANKCEITGPVYWIYYGADGNPNTVFSLEIAVPVFSTGNYTGIFELKVIPEFGCISEIHEGAWERLNETYGKLIEQALADGVAINPVSREIYIHMDFNSPENNITEVQLGVQR